jgi:hypothetical protein
MLYNDLNKTPICFHLNRWVNDNRSSEEHLEIQKPVEVLIGSNLEFELFLVTQSLNPHH